jgi:hypothetical protein
MMNRMVQEGADSLGQEGRNEKGEYKMEHQEITVITKLELMGERQ